MPVTTRAVTRSGTQDGQNSQQGNGVGAGATREPAERQDNDGETDVHRPMTLRQMQDIIDNQILSDEQLQVLTNRIRALMRARTGKRAREDLEDKDAPRKRRVDHDLKYNNIKGLKIGSTLKAWSD